MGRTNHSDGRLGQCSVAVLTALLLALCLPGLAESTEAPQGKQWKVKCEQAVCPGRRLKLTVGPQKIIVTVRGIAKDRDRVAFSIPVGDVITFAYHTVEHGSAEGWNDFWSGMDPSTPGMLWGRSSSYRFWAASQQSWSK